MDFLFTKIILWDHLIFIVEITSFYFKPWNDIDSIEDSLLEIDIITLSSATARHICDVFHFLLYQMVTPLSFRFDPCRAEFIFENTNI